MKRILKVIVIISITTMISGCSIDTSKLSNNENSISSSNLDNIGLLNNLLKELSNIKIKDEDKENVSNIVNSSKDIIFNNKDEIKGFFEKNKNITNEFMDTNKETINNLKDASLELGEEIFKNIKKSLKE